MNEIKKLAKQLYSDDSNAVMQATWKLGEIKDVRAAEVLLEFLKADCNAFGTNHLRARQKDVQDALIKLGKPAVPALLKELNERDFDITMIHILGEIRDASATPDIITFLEDANYQVRKRAVIALGQIGDSRAITPLFKLLGKYDQDFDSRIVFSLNGIGSVYGLIKALESPTFLIRNPAFDYLRRLIRDPGLTPSLEKLFERSAEVKKAAAENENPSKEFKYCICELLVEINRRKNEFLGAQIDIRLDRNFKGPEKPQGESYRLIAQCPRRIAL